MAVELIKRADLQVVDPASVKLRGYAAVFSNVFTQGIWLKHRYMVMPGAFTKALARLDGKALPVFWSHQQERLQIGETTELRQDDHGLYYEAKPFGTADALDVLDVINNRETPIQASFAFDFGEIVETDEGVEEIHSFAAIHEVGPTTWGANPKAFTELVPLDAAATTAPEMSAVIEPEPSAVALAAALWRATAQLRS